MNLMETDVGVWAGQDQVPTLVNLAISLRVAFLDQLGDSWSIKVVYDLLY
jgi:hypothetical protein